MLHKNTFFGIIAAIVYAQSALGVASMQTASDTTQSGTSGTLSRAGSLRTSTTRTVSTNQKPASNTNDASSARLTSSVGGISAVGIKSNKLTKSTAATGAALTELERKIDDLYVDIYDRRTVDAKLADKVDRGSDFNQEFDTRFGTKSVPTQSMVTNLDTRLTTAEGKITTIENSPSTDENTVNSLIDSAVATKKLVDKDYVSSAVDGAKGYADGKFALKTSLADKADASVVNSLTSRVGTAESSITTLQGGLSAKANSEDVYTKEEVNTKLAGVSSGVGEEQVQQMISSAVDSTIGTNYYDKETTDSKFALKTSLADKADASVVNSLTSRVGTAESNISTLQSGLSAKANSEDVYTKEEVNSKLAGVSSGVGEEQVQQMITSAVNSAISDNYYDKDHTYSQSEINSAISSAMASATDSANTYTDGKITGLATTSYVDSQVANKVTTTQLADALSQYDTSTVTSEKIQAATSGLVSQSALENYYNKGEVDQKVLAASNGMSEEQVQGMIGTAVNTAIGNNYYDKEETDTLLAAKANVASVYTKTQADATFATKDENAANLETAKTYADTKVATLTTQSQNYADASAQAALEAAKAYFDTSVTLPVQPDMSDYYNKEETDELLANKVNVATVNTLTSRVDDNATNIAALQTSLDEKADKTTVNTLTSRVDDNATDIAALQTSLDEKADKTTVNTLTGRVNSAESNITTLQEGLSNVYSKTEVDDKIVAASTGLGEQQVQGMIDSAVASAIGDNYYTKTAADGKFATITTTNSLSSALSDKANASSVYTKTEVDTKLNGKLNSTALNDYSTTTQMNSAINSAVANLASKSDVQELERTVTSGLAARPTTEQTLAMVNGAQLCGGTIRAEETDQGSSTRITVYCDD